MSVHLHPLGEQSPFHNVKNCSFPALIPPVLRSSRTRVPLLPLAFEYWDLCPAPWDAPNILQHPSRGTAKG